MSRAVAPVIWKAGSWTVGIQKKENDSVDDSPRPVAVTRKGPERRKPGFRGLPALGAKIIESADTPTPVKLLAVNAKLILPIEQVVPSTLFNDVVKHVSAKDAFGQKDKQQSIAIAKSLTLKFIEASSSVEQTARLSPLSINCMTVFSMLDPTPSRIHHSFRRGGRGGVLSGGDSMTFYQESTAALILVFIVDTSS